MQRCLSKAVKAAAPIILGGAIVVCMSVSVLAQAQHGDETASRSAPRDLYLEVFIDGQATKWIAHFQEADEGLSIAAHELENVGIGSHPDATGANGNVYVKRLPDVSYRIDEKTQSIFFEASLEARSTHVIKAMHSEPDGVAHKPQSSYGTVLNYTLFANSKDLTNRDTGYFEGISAGIDARMFSPYGILSQSLTARTNGLEFDGITRLDTTWTYSDPGRMLTYQAGDIIGGGLSWTRPVRLGGIRIARNFGLRPDLVTIPLPAFSGTAAVSSTVEIYQQNARTFTGTVPAGPFRISDLPIYTGAGTVSVVLRDALGRETRTDVPFFASSQFLQAGLWDFSAEVGFARRNFGIASDNYDKRVMGSGSLRYGLSDRLTLEGHVEGGEGLVNGGIGTILPLGCYGVMSLAGAGSLHRGMTGGLVNASMQLGYGGYSLFGRFQKTFGLYDDIASVTAEKNLVPSLTDILPAISTRVPKTLAQIGVSLPVLDFSSLHLSYALSEYEKGNRNQFLGLTYSQTIQKRATFHISAFADVENKGNYGIFAGVSIPFGEAISVSSGVHYGPGGANYTVDAIKPEGHEPGSLGWRLHMSEGDVTRRTGVVSHRSGIGRVEGGIEQLDDNIRVRGQVEGAIVAAGGDVFLSKRIDDAFAVVDVGVANVEVTSQNRRVGKTGRSGRILVPDLHAYGRNQIAIDPTNLPVDADIPTTREVVVPAGRSGVVVDFGIKARPAAALVTFIDPAGDPLPVGASGTLEAKEQTFVVGYDGKAYIQDLASKNAVTITRSDGSSCRALFSYKPAPGTQVVIDKVVCQ